MRALAAVLLLLFAPLAVAAAVLDLSVEELTQRSHLVVRGTVTRVWAEWDSGHRRIWTYAELTPSASLKGRAAAVVKVRQPGGVVGGIAQEISGAAKFTAGEEVVLFLERAPDDPGTHQVLAMAAGAVRLRRGPNGELRAGRDLEGLELVKQRAPQTVRVLDRDDLGTAEEFLARVKAAAKR